MQARKDRDKIMCKEHKIENKYNPKEFESKLYEKWNNKGYFKPSDDRTKKPYTIMMPPPNITGKLHMGHALDDTIQDVLIRYKRMQGYNALWLPGTDHAALSTEAKIVAKLKEEGIKKSDLTREEFLKRAWEWKEEYGGMITSQVRKIGCSCDWTRERFTLDEGLSKAVYKVFKKMYDEGLIYKGKRMINWCTGCNTSISDAEIEYTEEPTHLWHIKYKVTDSDMYLIVATTRPETMLGDTAVAVNPNDDRYKDLIGKTCILPIMNKEIPIIGDRFVETEFGTGCVKVTPAHDMNDYQAGIDHNLEIIEVFDEHLKMNDLCPEFAGMDIYEAREKIVEKLKEIGALVKIEDYKHNVAKCDRCHNTIEPRISNQWFVKMEPLAKPAIEAVRNGTIKFVPERYEKIYFNWMENIRDWCISRQIWWGHQIPAYYCDKCGKITVSDTTPEKCEHCGHTSLTRDTDTLDTWFSSALWPFSTLGWPDDTEDLRYFYPTNTLVTAYDIIQTWVSRMIFSGLAHMGEKPFDHVFIHGIVRDAQGRKMSKSLGNGIDPLEIIEKYGADALRFSLILGISPGNDIRYMPEKLESASNFANKLWNASKFVLMQLEDAKDIVELTSKDMENLSYVDKWILAKCNTLVKEVTANLDKFELGVATQKIYDFIRNDFCDWYIEVVKPRLFNKENPSRRSIQTVLNTVLCISLKLLHPIMPFVTEEIYTKMYNNDESIMISEWPKYNKNMEFVEEQEQFEQIKQIIIEIRSIRNNMNVHPSKKTKLICVTDKYENVIKESVEFLEKLAFAEEIIIQDDKENIPDKAISVITKDIEVYIPSEELVNIEEEKKRLEGEKEKILFEIKRASKMLSNPGFVNKAPETKINEEKEKLAKYEEMLKMIEQRLQEM